MAVDSALEQPAPSSNIPTDVYFALARNASRTTSKHLESTNKMLATLTALPSAINTLGATKSYLKY